MKECHQKIVVHHAGTTQLPALWSGAEAKKLSRAEKSRRRDKVLDLEAENLPDLIDAFKDISLSVRQMVPKEAWGEADQVEVEYDLSINFSTVSTVSHMDERRGDGPGAIIVLGQFQREGLLVFGCETDPEEPFLSRWLEEGCFYMFWKDLRYKWSHGVWSLDCDATGTFQTLDQAHDTCRVVCTWRYGVPRQAYLDAMKVERAPATKERAR